VRDNQTAAGILSATDEEASCCSLQVMPRDSPYRVRNQAPAAVSGVSRRMGDGSMSLVVGSTR
jgi:hypothetical protein